MATEGSAGQKGSDAGSITSAGITGEAANMLWQRACGIRTPPKINVESWLSATPATLLQTGRC